MKFRKLAAIVAATAMLAGLMATTAYAQDAEEAPEEIVATQQEEPEPPPQETEEPTEPEPVPEEMPESEPEPEPEPDPDPVTPPDPVAPEPETSNGGPTTSTVTGGSEKDNRLPAPGNPHWLDSPAGYISWDYQEDLEYASTLYRDGEHVVSYGRMRGELSVRTFYRYIEQSGVYTFDMYAQGYSENENSAVVSSVNEFLYERPAAELPTPTNLRWGEIDGGYLLEWDAVEGFDAYTGDTYNITLGVVRSWGLTEKVTFLDRFGEALFIDAGSEYFNEDAEYYFIVQAISGDILTVAHSVKSEPSPFFNLTSNIDEVHNTLNDILDRLQNGEGTAAEAYEELLASDTYDIAVMASALQARGEVVELVKTLEDAYMAQNGLSVSTAIDNAVGDQLDIGKVSVTGAAFNAKEGISDLTLNFSKPAEEISWVSSNYSYSVQLDIHLDGADEGGRLEFPVQITMPVPAGIQANRMVLYHQLMNGNIETIRPVVNADGTVTFTVTSFSTFAFANLDDGEEPGNPDENGGEGPVEPEEPGNPEGPGGNENGGGSSSSTGPKSYAILDGANSVYSGGANGLVIRSEGDFSKFTGVTLDGKALALGEDYTVAEGSTIVTLNASLLQTLADGTHTLVLQFTDGSSTVSFTVSLAPPAPTPTPNSDDVQTGDSGSLPLFVTIALLATGALLLAALKKRKLSA